MTCFSDCETPNACNEQPSKKKISVTQRKRSSIEEGEEKGNCATIDYFNKLSADVITSLFLRCPLRSLFMLRCTSKYWNDFIISPSFLHSHLRQSTENAPNFFLWRRTSCTDQKGPGCDLFRSTWMEARRSYTLPQSLMGNLLVAQCKYAMIWFAFQRIVVLICAILPCNNCVNCRNVHLLLPLDITIWGLDIFSQGRTFFL
ncbi:uncharacterized protein LOC107864184 isoform X1 [Capsicum annuum]|uniref:uncharacterized protein LOC107864184 isoform X1 n=1 Tax=Capsicum annuum TaxID=4072 RepID=UPI001FB0FA58|nr:uncharacterized protein LOC107864184 isoform X1 [Capsicum annuum]XP_047265047.1 uncharacterized protein LOC107864184 isoform X1 [Capsicum annuum]